MFEFAAGHRVLIVGGAGDIGSAMAAAFLAQGCEVIATGVDEAAVAACRLPAAPALTLAALDVTDDAAVADFAGGLDRLDTLVNCAGILARGREFELATFQRVIDVNLTGAFRMCAACQPLLAASTRCPSIINTASMNAYMALPFIPAYCASKGGVVMLTKSLALAWAGSGIRVNAVAPGYVETSLNAAGRRDPAHYARIRDRIPQGRWAQPDDIAGGALFLASAAARYIAGTVLPIDGGFLAN
ncbi:oxidoreductase [Bordetella genomosp. 9]|uniref:SDR family NAD(P)-dependent oxidoreductase n=1 Tax=Bordetella genomosp. 9 TaxID=1416803 RepID=UPI000A28F6E5|nr:SDR family NAD(P)-dependent oxidoreductase [Bordetella genomosp. 9]ARP91516.1 oxidoreductase [Bordetella genomosp. 9]